MAAGGLVLCFAKIPDDGGEFLASFMASYIRKSFIIKKISFE